MSDWLSIDSAPADPLTILIAGRYPNGRWYVEESYRHPNGHFNGRKLQPPTHWQPMPAPPAMTNGERT